MTEKDNFKLLLSGQMPEFIPTYNMFAWRFYPKFGTDRMKPDGSGFDCFGVEYATAKEADGASIPAPGKYILDDITKWRDIIKTPDTSNVDWETFVKHDLENRDSDNNPLLFATHNGYFQALMKFMGFENGLCAMYEEPEEVYALFEYLSEYYLELQRQYTRYGNLTGINLTDDTATALNPFISMDMYHSLLKPIYKKHTDMALNDGLLLTIHNCGRCEDQIGDWLDMGISGWDPAQICNDLKGIKAKYGRRLAIIGGWDSSGPASWPPSDDKLLKDALVQYVDTMAPGGGFCFAAHVMGMTYNEDSKRKVGIIMDFYKKLCARLLQDSSMIVLKG
jgi:hypothetical protein